MLARKKGNRFGVRDDEELARAFLWTAIIHISASWSVLIFNTVEWVPVLIDGCSLVAADLVTAMTTPVCLVTRKMKT